jgi:hypothetical protein
MLSEGLGKFKDSPHRVSNPRSPRLVALCLNHYATACPSLSVSVIYGLEGNYTGLRGSCKLQRVCRQNG